MPETLKTIVSYTPFQSIYFTPINIYLGELDGASIVNSMLVQIMWILILGAIAGIMWNKGTKKLVVQGG